MNDDREKISLLCSVERSAFRLASSLARRRQLFVLAYLPCHRGLGFIHESLSAARPLYGGAVRDHSPGLLGLGFCQKEFALKGRHTYVAPNRIISGGGDRNRFGCPLQGRGVDAKGGMRHTLAHITSHSILKILCVPRRTFARGPSCALIGHRSAARRFF